MADEAKVVVGGDVAGATNALEQLASQVKSQVGAIKGQFEQLNAAVEKVKSVFMAVALAFEGGKLFKGAVEETVRLSGELRSLQVVLGISADGAAGLREALAQIGSSSETYIGVVQRMTMHLRTNEARFNEMGVTTRDANGHLLDSETQLQNTLEALKNFKEGTDRNLASTELLGRSWVEASKLLKLNKEQMEEAKRSAVELGLAMGPQQAAQMAHFKKAGAEVHAVLEGMAKGVTEIVMPGLIEMAEWFRSIGPEAIAVTKAAVATFSIVISGLIAGIEMLWAAFKMLVQQLATLALTLADVVPNLIRWDWKGAKEAAARGLGQIKDQYTTYLTEIADISKNFQKKVQRALDPEGALPAAAAGAKGTREYTPSGKDTSAAQLDHQVEMAKLGERIEAAHLKELAEMQQITNLQRIEMEKQVSQSVYEYARGVMIQKTALYKTDSIEYEKAMNAIQKFDAERALERMRLDAEAAAERKRMLKEADAVQKEAIDAQIDRLKRAAQQTKEFLKEEEEDWNIRARDRIAAERELAQNVYLAQRRLLEDKIGLARDDSKEQARIGREIEKLDAEHNVEMQRNAREAAKEAARAWDEAFKAIQRAFATSVQGIIMGTTTLKSALGNLWNSIVLEFITVMVVKPLTEWAAAEARKTIMVMMGTQQRAGIEAAAAVEGAAEAKI